MRTSEAIRRSRAEGGGWRVVGDWGIAECFGEIGAAAHDFGEPGKQRSGDWRKHKGIEQPLK
jgi:hypothetical protein